MACRLPPLNALRVFETTARHLSFKAAAVELSVTPTAVSHQIRDLENNLGQLLFHRLPRKIELTAAGEALLPKIAEGMRCFFAAIEDLHSLTGKSSLVIKAGPTFASRWLVPRLASFTSMHPDFVLHLSSSLEMIDDTRPGAAQANLSSYSEVGEPEIEIRFGVAEPRSGYVMTSFLPTEYTVVCAASLQQGEDSLKSPEDICHHNLIHDDTILDERLRPTWEKWCAAAGIKVSLSQQGTHFHDSGLVLAAVADGMGIALLARQLVGPDVEAGRVTLPFNISIPSAFSFYLAIPERVAQRREVMAFRDWILAEV